jgi:photosystem II reaction center protein PsbP
MRISNKHTGSGRGVVAIVAIAVTAVAVGCGGSGDSGSGGNAEAQSAATGDIPDNQVFLRFSDRPAGYSIKYPEGWTQRGNGNDVTFQDKGNSIHVTVATGPPPTPSSAKAELAKLKASDSSLQPGTAQQLSIGGAPAIKVTYRTQSPPDPVTGKRLPLITDRYEYAKGGKVATLDLATPKGVDNVDAYRLISESFRWQ